MGSWPWLGPWPRMGPSALGLAPSALRLAPQALRLASPPLAPSLLATPLLVTFVGTGRGWHLPSLPYGVGVGFIPSGYLIFGEVSKFACVSCV
jgi:hypothetical protein